MLQGFGRICALQQGQRIRNQALPQGPEVEAAVGECFRRVCDQQMFLRRKLPGFHAPLAASSAMRGLGS
jgi:hypothetical protein